MKVTVETGPVGDHEPEVFEDVVEIKMHQSGCVHFVLAKYPFTMLEPWLTDDDWTEMRWTSDEGYEVKIVNAGEL